MNEIILNSPAKINIGLNIIEKRNDGFHDLETIFYPLLLSDTITIEKSNETKIDTNSKELDRFQDNLILRTISSLEKFCNKSLPVKVTLDKNIPIGAGLGGGSSNAATTLKALNRLYELKITPSKLAEIALSIGSDLPFFLNPVPSLGCSRGELLKKIDLQISQPILVVNPGIHISTKWAFENININDYKKRKLLLGKLNKFSLSELIPVVNNDFEDVVFKSYPEIEKIKYRLLDYGAMFASLSGTGSSVYGIFSNLQIARKAKDELNANYFTFLNYPVNTGSIT